MHCCWSIQPAVARWVAAAFLKKHLFSRAAPHSLTIRRANKIRKTNTRACVHKTRNTLILKPYISQPPILRSRRSPLLHCWTPVIAPTQPPCYYRHLHTHLPGMPCAFFIRSYVFDIRNMLTLRCRHNGARITRPIANRGNPDNPCTQHSCPNRHNPNTPTQQSYHATLVALTEFN